MVYEMQPDKSIAFSEAQKERAKAKKRDKNHGYLDYLKLIDLISRTGYNKNNRHFFRADTPMSLTLCSMCNIHSAED